MPRDEWRTDSRSHHFSTKAPPYAEIAVPILVLILIVVLIGTWLHTRDRRRLLRLFQSQAARRQGTVTQASMISIPRLYLTLHGVEVRVTALNRTIDSRDTGMMTCVEFPVCNPEAPQVRIRERRWRPSEYGYPGPSAPTWKVVIGPLFSLGDTEFDGRFQLVGDRPEESRVLLNRDELVRSLLGLPFPADIRVEEESCLVSIQDIPETEESLDRLIEAASEILLALIQYNA